MAYNQSDMAVVLPSNIPQIERTANTLYVQSERRRLEAERDAARQQQRQDMLGKYVGDQFDDKDYMTGTEMDPAIHQRLTGAKEKYSQMLMKNPGMSIPELQFMMQKDLGGISDYASRVKAIRANIDEGAKEFDKSPGIDGGALRKLGYSDAFFKTDPKTGQRVAKEANELDPSQDYLTPAVMNHPEKYLDEGKAWDATMENLRKNKYKVGDDFETAFGGRNRKKAYAGDLYPFQQVLKDENKKVIPDAAGNAQYVLKTTPAMLDGKPITGEDGKPMEIMDPEVYQHFNMDKGTRAILNKQLNEFNAGRTKNGQVPIPDGTPEADILKSSFLKERLQNVPTDFTTVDKTTEANFLARHQAGMDIKVGLDRESKELLKQQKENAKLDGLDPGVALRALGGEGAVLEGANPETINGRKMFNITGEIGGIKLQPDKDGKSIIAQGIYVDPVSKTMSVTDANGVTTDYKGKDIRKWWKHIAPFNGVTFDKVDKVLNMHLDANGNYIGKEDKQSVIKMGVDRDIEKHQYQKAVDSKSLTELKGFTLPDSSTIEDISTRPNIGQLIGMDKYSVKIKGADGKIVTQTFPTEEKLREYLKAQSK